MVLSAFKKIKLFFIDYTINFYILQYFLFFLIIFLNLQKKLLTNELFCGKIYGRSFAGKILTAE